LAGYCHLTGVTHHVSSNLCAISLISCYVSTLIATSPSFPLGHFRCSTGIVHSCACQCGCLQRHQSQCSRFIKSGLFEKATHVNS
jgi:hypothetical protein